MRILVGIDWSAFLVVAMSGLSAESPGTGSHEGSRALPPDSAAKAAFYVSPDGNDRWTGKLAKPNPDRTDGPLATVGKARDAVRQIKASAAGPIMVCLRGGLYELNEPLVFAPPDSGSPKAPIIYAAYPGETPILSGGRRITGWKEGPDGLWMAPAPGVKEGQWHFRQLFVDGQRRQRARTPTKGFFQVDGQVSPDDPAAFRFHPGDIRPEWAAQGDVEVIDLNKWQTFRMPIKAVDEQTNTVTLAGKRLPSSIEKDSRYWIENAEDGLDAPGEWRLDRREGVVYYRPLPGEDLARAQVIAPRLERLILLQGDPNAGGHVHDLTLRGLTVSYADWSMPAQGFGDIQADADGQAAVEAAGALSCAIEHCTFAHFGRHALAFGKGSKQNRIVGNEITDVGAGGIKIGDPFAGVHPTRHDRGEFRFPLDAADYQAQPNYPRNEAETSSGNLVSDNHIHDIGIVYPGAVGIWVGQSPDNTIAHNEIHDTCYSGISCGWTWGFGPTAARDNVIEFNHVHHIGRGIMSDMGGIYVLGIQPGTVLRNNRIHDVTRDAGPEGYGGWGIYLDATTSQVRVENNVIYHNYDGAIHQNQGQQNTIVNNVLALGGKAQFQRSNTAPKLSFTFEHNIVCWKTGDLFRTLLRDGRFSFDYNLYYNMAGEPVEFGRSISGRISWDEWRSRGQDAHSIIADPLFADPEGGDFSLRPGSPAFQIGFKPIDVSQVGPRRGERE